MPANLRLREVLDRDGRVAVVGLPCHIHGLRLANAVNPAHALFYAQRIPRQIKIDQDAAKLEIAALARCLRREQYGQISMKILDRLILLLAGQPAMIERKGDTPPL